MELSIHRRPLLHNRQRRLATFRCKNFLTSKRYESHHNSGPVRVVFGDTGCSSAYPEPRRPGVRNDPPSTPTARLRRGTPPNSFACPALRSPGQAPRPRGLPPQRRIPIRPGGSVVRQRVIRCRRRRCRCCRLPVPIEAHPAVPDRVPVSASPRVACPSGETPLVRSRLIDHPRPPEVGKSKPLGQEDRTRHLDSRSSWQRKWEQVKSHRPRRRPMTDDLTGTGQPHGLGRDEPHAVPPVPAMSALPCP